MRNRIATLKISTKAAALVEYVVLMSLIGIVLIAVVLDFGSTVGRTYDTVETIIDNPTSTPVPDGGTTPPGDPTIPTFPPYTGTPSGIEYVSIYDATLNYFDSSTTMFANMAAFSFYPGHDTSSSSIYNLPTTTFDWFTEVTWVSLTPSSGNNNTFNELEFYDEGMTYNNGPLPGWGPSPYDLTSCRSITPDSLQYQLVGYLDNGDRALLYINISPEPCELNYVVEHDVQIWHNRGGIGTYGDIVNTELGASNTLDWNDALWSHTGSDFPNNGLIFSDITLGATQYSYNLDGGPAWHSASGSTACRERPWPGRATLIGTHPNGATTTLYINFFAYQPDNPDNHSDCYEP